MNPVDAYALREAVRQVLVKHGLYENVQLEFDLLAAVNALPASATAADKLTADQRRSAVLDALSKGLSKDEQVKTEWDKLFHTSPNWNTKTNRDILVWLKDRLDNGEPLAKFADWWRAEDFRGKAGAPPTTAQVRELWALAFQEGGVRQGKDSRAQSLPEGL